MSEEMMMMERANMRTREDDDVILKGYSMLKDCIEDFRDVCKKTDAVREYCSQEHFSVSGFSYSTKVERCCTSMQEMIKKLDEFAELLVSVVDEETLQEFRSREMAALIKTNANEAAKDGTEFGKVIKG